MVPGRTHEDLLATLLKRLEVLELEAARLMVISKVNSEDKVLGASASLIYQTVAALREDINALRNSDAAAGNY